MGYAIMLALAYTGNFFSVLWFWIPGEGKREPRENYLQPAGYAFSIWGLIFATEGISLFWQLAQLLIFSKAPTKEVESRVKTIQKCAFLWFFAIAFQSLWTSTENELFDSAWKLLVPTVALAMPPFFFNAMHQEFMKESRYRDWRRPDYWCMTVPFTLHFGWSCAAALVMLNAWVARVSVNPDLKAAIAMLSVLVAGILAVEVSVQRRHAFFGFVLTWALLAVSIGTLFQQVDMRDKIGGHWTNIIGCMQACIFGVVYGISIGVCKKETVMSRDFNFARPGNFKREEFTPPPAVVQKGASDVDLAITNVLSQGSREAFVGATATGAAFTGK